MYAVDEVNNVLNNKNNYLNYGNYVKPIDIDSKNTSLTENFNSDIKTIVPDKKNPKNVHYWNNSIDNTSVNQYKTEYSQGNSMYDNRGKYFDTWDFNSNFDAYIKEQEKLRLLNEELRTSDLTNIDSIKIYPFQLPVQQILINTKNTWYTLFSDLQNGINPFNSDNHDNYDKLFYISISLIIFSIIYLFFYVVFQ